MTDSEARRGHLRARAAASVALGKGGSAVVPLAGDRTPRRSQRPGQHQGGSGDRGPGHRAPAGAEAGS